MIQLSNLMSTVLNSATFSFLRVTLIPIVTASESVIHKLHIHKCRRNYTHKNQSFNMNYLISLILLIVASYYNSYTPPPTRFGLSNHCTSPHTFSNSSGTI